MAEAGEVPRDIVCVGASSGGVGALVQFVAQLPVGMPAAVFIVLHTAPGAPGTLAAILGRATPWPVAFAIHGEPIAPGRIRIAPADHHLLLVDGETRLDRGPLENRVRPAVDTLFRSAAVYGGARVVGVVLTGQLSDGSAGARAIVRGGGVVVVQSPDDAEASSMPRAALASAAPEHVVPLRAMGRLLAEVVGRRVPQHAVPPDLALEVDAGMRLGEGSVEANDRLGERAPYTCPDCGGPLWRLAEGGRFRCQLGHAMNLDVLEGAKGQASAQALWIAARTLDERVRLLDDMARSLRRGSQTISAQAYEARADEVRAAAEEVRRLLRSIPPPLDGSDP